MHMLRISRRAVLLGGMTALAASKAHAAAAVPVDAAGGRCIATVMLDGRAARMLIDTGAARSVITRSAVLRLGLQPDPWVGTTLRGAGDVLEHHANALVREARLGGVMLMQRNPADGLSLSVTGSDLAGLDGLLGNDVLRHATLYLDMQRSRLLLLPPTQQVQGGVPLARLGENLLLAPVRLDGHDLVALIDTGASASLLNARGIYRLGIAGSRAHDPAVATLAVGGTLATRAHRFATLAVGPLLLAAPTILVADVPEAGFDITLGLDVLGTRPLVLSYAALRLAFGTG